MPAPMDPDLTMRIFRIMRRRLLKANHAWTLEDIGKFTGVSDTCARHHVKKLIDQGKIVHVGFAARRTRIFALPNETVVDRIKCLKCQGLFVSEGAGNRLCERCRIGQRYVTGGLDEVRYPSTGRIKSPHSGAL